VESGLIFKILLSELSSLRRARTKYQAVEHSPDHTEDEHFPSFTLLLQECAFEEGNEDVELLQVLPSLPREDVELWFLQRALTHPIATKEDVNLIGSAINDALTQYGISNAPKYSYKRFIKQRSKLPSLDLHHNGSFVYLSLQEIIAWVLSVPKYRHLVHTDFEEK